MLPIPLFRARLRCLYSVELFGGTDANEEKETDTTHDRHVGNVKDAGAQAANANVHKIDDMTIVENTA